MKKNFTTKMLACMLAGIMILTCGCAKNPAQNPVSGGNASGGGTETKEETADDFIVKQNTTGMGRYVEAESDLPEDLGGAVGVGKLDDGTFRVGGMNGQVYDSKDNGVTWEPSTLSIPKIMESRIYVNAMAFSPSGETALSYVIEGSLTEKADAVNIGEEQVSDETVSEEKSSDEKTTEETTSEETTSKETASEETASEETTSKETASEETASEETETDEKTEESNLSTETTDFIPKYMLINADGTKTEITIDAKLLGDHNFVNDFYFGKDGRLFCCDLRGKVMEINKETGETSEMIDNGGFIDCASVTDQYIFLLSNGKERIFDLSTKEEIPEDKILNQFFGKSENLTYENNAGERPALIMQAESEDAVYVATKSGFYHHVVGGNVMEMMIDGSLSTFGMPSTGLIDMFPLGENEFLVFFTNDKCVHYTYDKSIKSVPDTQLKVFGLKDNSTVRQAITDYQKQNPDIYIKYEIGMSEGSGITREDALKNLNTEIMAGAGPDLLLLDGISVDTYQQKGMLVDLTPYLTEMDAENVLFTNITNAYEKDGAVYAIPARFSYPVIAGRKDQISTVKDINSLTKLVKEIRSENATGGIFGWNSERNILQSLFTGCAPGIVDEKGTVDEAKLTEFITDAKDIWIAEEHKVDEEEARYYEGLDYSDAMMLQVGNHVIDIPRELNHLAYGYSNGIDFDYSLIHSVFKTMPDYGSALGNLGCGNVYYPSSVVGISAASKQQEQAGKFLETLLGEDVQQVTFSDGYPVNKKAMEKIFSKEKEGEECGMMGMSDQDGSEFTVTIFWPNKEQKDAFYDMVNQLDTANTVDDFTKETIIDNAIDALNGNKEVSEVVKEIMDKIKLRSAE